MSLLRVLRFQPKELPKAVGRAVRVHPHTASALPGVEGTLLEELLSRLMECGEDQGLLERFGATMTPREQRGLVSAILLGDASLTWRIAAAVRPHLRASLVGPLWRTWQKVPLDPLALDLLRSAAQAFGASGAVAPEWAELVEGWLHTEPIEALLDWVDSQAMKLEELPVLSRSPIEADVPLIDELWRLLLTMGSAEQLGREHAAVVRSRGFSLGPEDVQAFGANYLAKVTSANWSLSILKELRTRYGLPDARDSRPAFWNRVADPARGAFRRLFLQRDLQTALGGATDRHRFWESWAKEMRDVTLGSAGGTGYAILEFATFGVVEFFEHGNAAYFYDLATVDQIRRVKPSHPSDIKVGDDRLIHGGAWQGRAQTMVLRRLRKKR